MGGKQKKQTQRTKGNTRPSSSSRSAVRLMQVEGTSRAGDFPGLHQQQQQPGIMESFGSMGLATAQLILGSKISDSWSAATETDDDDCRTLLKKMAKKDSITRLKALQEFHSYCTTCSEEALKAALPYWPRLYNRLSSDNDRRVREAAHKAQCQVVIKAGRSMAPHLKSLIGPWMMGRCDPHGPAASAANAAFLEAFKGPTKQADALIFCKEDFILHILDVAYNQTPQALCDAEICPAEESESTHNRLLSVALLALTLYLDTVPIFEQSKSVETYSGLFSKPKFWKFPKCQEANIKAAWFGLIAAFCRIQPLVIEPHLARTSPLVLGALDEEDPVVCPRVWEATLHLIGTHVDCWNHVNFPKAIAPKLYSIAKKGFDGNAVATCPNLLPFLSNIPDVVLQDKHLFYNALFKNIRLGLGLPRIQSSPTDCSAIVSALVECVKFIVTNNTDFEEDFVLSHLLPTVETSLVENSPTLSATSLYSLISEYFTTKGDDTLEDVFWNKMTPSCFSAMEQSRDSESSFILKRLAYMLSCFAGATRHAESISKKSTKRKVNFATLEGKKEKTILPKEESVKSKNLVLKGALLTVGSNLCVASQKRYVQEKSVEHLEFLSKMIPLFATPHLFQNLLNIDDDYVGGDVSSLAMKYFEVTLEQWLYDLKSQSIDEMDERIIAALMSLIIDAILPLVRLEDQSTVLEKICLLRNVKVLERLLRTMMKDLTWLKSSAVREWLKSPGLGVNIITFTETSIKNSMTFGVTSNDDRTTWRLLALCFETFSNFNPILSIDVLSVILDTLGSAISNLTTRDSSTGSVVDEVLTLVAKLATGLFHGMPNCWRISACEDILLAFFLLLCRPSIVSIENAKVIEDFIIDGTALLIHNQGLNLVPTGFIYKASRHVHNFLIKGSTEHLENLTEVFMSLFSAICQALCAASECDSFGLKMNILEVAFLTPDEHQFIENEVVKWNLLDHVMRSELCILSPPVKSIAYVKQSASDNRKINNMMLASAYLVSEGLLNVLNSDRGSFDDRFITHLVKVIFASAYCKVCLRNQNKLNWSAEMVEIKNWLPKVESNLKGLIEQLPLGCVSTVLSECLTLSEDHGLFWSYALLQLEDIIELSKTDYKVDHEKIMHVQKAITTEGVLHNIQLRLISRNMSTIARCSIVKAVLEHPRTAENNVNCLAILASGLCHLDVDYFQTLLDLVPKFDVSCTPNEWPVVCRNVQVCRVFTQIVNKHTESLAKDHWDCILCRLGTWLVEVNEDQLQDLQSMVFATSVFKFAYSVSTTINQLRSTGKLHPDLQTEWDEFFAVRIYKRLMCLFVFWSEHFDESDNDLLCIKEYALESLARALIGTPASVTVADTAMLPKDDIELPILLIADWDDDDQSSSINVKTTLNHLCPLLEHRLRIIQYGAYHSLKDLMITLSQSYKDTKVVKEDDVKDDSKESTFPGALLATLMHSKIRLEEGSFTEVKIGNDALIIKENCDCSDIFGYLLAWDLVLKMFSQSSSEIRFRNASYFRENGLVQHLLNCLFILMPNNVNLTEDAASSFGEITVKKADVKRTTFTEASLLDPEVPQSVNDIRHLACSVYLAAVQHIPALVREWFNGLDRRSSSVVERFTMTNVTPLLCSMDLAAVRQAESAHLLRGLKVRVRPGPREVLATCTVEDISFEIVVRLAENHPLGAVTIEAGRPIGVSNSQWSYWTLQLTTFLMHQNGSILDGLLLWKRNIDKKFEGVQECYVCFYVLHGTSYQLPKHMCRTCKKKFHSSCLYKWFSTSGHSTCPLCRSIF